jgi:tetratricopeptide (TPR) repeat protein
MNLSIALNALGRQERLEEALAVSREALQESTRELSPLQWTAAQMVLGNALQALGRRESGAARLEESVTAYREALKGLNRECMSLEWARTQDNLAELYLALFNKTHRPVYLEDALGAVGGALEEYRNAKVAFSIEKAERLRDQILAMKDKP